MSKPIPSTRGRYIPGVGYTITQANIADEQARRVKAGEPPATPHDIVKAFCRPNGDHRGEKRHLARAMRLMANE